MTTYLATLVGAGVEESLLLLLVGFMGVLSLARRAVGRGEGGYGELCMCGSVCECVRGEGGGARRDIIVGSWVTLHVCAALTKTFGTGFFNLLNL